MSTVHVKQINGEISTGVGSSFQVVSNIHIDKEELKIISDYELDALRSYTVGSLLHYRVADHIGFKSQQRFT